VKWLILFLASSSAFAQTCDYNHKAQERYQYQIESVSGKDIFNRTYDSGASECTVKLDVIINSRMYPVKGSYIYGPDIPQSVACDRAELQAKENALMKFSPVKINSQKNMDCSLTSSKKEETVNVCRQWRTIFVDGVKTKGWKDICND